MLNGPPIYFHWGIILISLANLVVIGLMVLVFLLAALIPWRRPPGGERDRTEGGNA